MNTNHGSAAPYGINFINNFVNFSVHAPLALRLNILFYSPDNQLVKSVALDPKYNKTGTIWHIALKKEDILGLSYLYLLDDIHTVLDPYAKFLNTSIKWGDGAKPETIKGVVKQVDNFDWGHSSPPKYALKDLVIYEMHTRSFTIRADIGEKGTFLGIIDKIPYLKSLGINAIELMPIHEFNECENPQSGLYNYWGYSPIAYFAFMQRYASKKHEALNEFKTLVKALHLAGIAIIIDVVYNHTAEGGSSGPHYHFKYLDPKYYIHDKSGHLVDYSGCGNTLDANHNPAMNLILDSLKFLAIDCHVDGFRFDLASTFYRQSEGVLAHPRIIESILDDPVLSQKLLIAEAWDAKGLYQVGKFPKPFADWNGAYRDKVRSFLNHIPHSKGAFADAISGTASLYFDKTPDLSINFITAHDGFTLHDLFSYSHKHNLPNHENNRDGNDQNISQNCGHEGPSDDKKICEKRDHLSKLALSILMISLGTPMILMGDEYGHSREGNNNAYCHDSALNHFNWDKVNPEQIKFIATLVQLRKQIHRLSSTVFYDKHEISWHGLNFQDPAWETDDYFLILHIHNGYLIVINNNDHPKNVIIPKGQWSEIFHSTKHSDLLTKVHTSTHLFIEAHSLSVLEKVNV
jgi:isoamylase/glycogen operon protein